MNTIFYLELNVFALVILAIIFINIRNQAKQSLLESQLYLSLLAVNSLILIFDTLMWFFDGTTGHLMSILNLSVTVIYYILTPLTCMVWVFYVDYQINRDKKHLYKIALPVSIPAIVNFIMTIQSIWNHGLFYIDENNFYHRGNLFLIMAALSYSYLIYTFFYVLYSKHKLPSFLYFPLLTFTIPPFLGSVLQALFYGVSLTWVCMTISILITFITVQNNQLYTDHLTGLYNRRQLDYYLMSKIQNTANKKKVAGIMIDLNCFKKINDTFGHGVGDQALIHTANILKKSFTNNEFISRYGGDEFIIIIESKNEVDLVKHVNNININIKEFNNAQIEPYKIDLSIGADYFDCSSKTSIETFLKHIDLLMYEDKQRRTVTVI